MCGIYGMVVRPGARVEARVLEAMGAALGHRGPDATRAHSDGTAGLGATRLAIIDVEGGHQPVANEDGSVVVVQNGELFNYRALRDEVLAAGHRVGGAGDTALLPHLYEDDGPGFPARLRGMFAVAVWDAPRGRLTLARDRLGIKPLFYAETADGILFGSEIKAILAAGHRRELDRQALHHYLTLDYVPGPWTMFAGIRKLPAGHVLTWDAGSPVRSRALGLRRYWSLPPQWPEGRRAPDGDIPRGRADLAAALRARLEDAVEAAMVSDVPVGAFLSGGLDSSVVVALMRRVAGRPVATFSVGFNEASYDELPWARRVAAHCGTEHHETVVTPDVEGIAHRLVEAFDEPFADSSAIGSWVVAEQAARHARVVLSGDGGDEAFGGYVIYRADRLAGMYRALPAVLGRRLLPWLAERLPASERKMSLDLKLRRFTAGAASDPLAAHLAWRAIFDEAGKRALYAAPADGLAPTVDLLRAAHDAYPHADPLNRLMAVDQAVSLVDDMLTKVDRTSMAHSLEVRVPLLDHPLVEWLARVPAARKVTPVRLRLKALLKDAAEGLLPRDVVHRPKAGFHVPLPGWLRGELRPLLERQLAPAVVRRQGVFDPAAVDEVVRAHLAGRRELSRNLWGLLMFGLWHERHLE